MVGGRFGKMFLKAPQALAVLLQRGFTARRRSNPRGLLQGGLLQGGLAPGRGNPPGGLLRGLLQQRVRTSHVPPGRLGMTFGTRKLFRTR